MHKAIKLTGGLVLGLVLIVAAALAYLAVSFDPNDYRDAIATRVEAETGRTLTLDDPLSLQFFPWIGLKLGTASLSGPAAFADEAFVTIRSAGIKVKVMPLLQQRLEVDTIVLDGLDVMLATNAAGETNWDFTRIQGGVASDQDQTAPTLGGSNAGGGDLVAGLQINGIDITNASIHWRDAASATQYDLTRLSMKTGAIQSGAPIDFDLTTTFSGSSLPPAGLPLHLTGRSVLADDGQAVNIETLRLQSNDLDISAHINATLADTGPQYSGRFAIAAFDPRPLLEQLGVDLPAFSDPQAIRQVVAGLTFAGDDKQLDISELAIQFDDTTLKGMTHLTLNPAFAARSTLALDTLNVDRYLPPSATPTTVGAVKPVSTPTTATAAPLDLPLDTLRELQLNGTLSIGELIIAGLHTSNITTTLTADKGLIRLQPLQAELYQGATLGRLQLDARGKQPRFSLAQQLKGFQTEPFLKDLLDKELLSGQANMELELDTIGDSVEALTAHLNGSARLSFSDGAIKGINVADQIRRTRAKIEQKPVPEKAALQTDFTALAATITIKNGIASNNDLNVQAPYLRLGGDGSADLNKKTVDYRLKAKVVSEAKGQGGEDLESLRGTPIPIRIHGPLADPEIKLDSAVIRELLRKRIQKKAQKAIDKEQEKVQERVEEKREELKDKLEDKLKNKLKKLF